MTWTNLLAYIRLRIPAAGQTSVISDANMLILANLVCKEFVDMTDCLPTNTTFNAVADQQEYTISTYVTSFLKMRREGLWWYNSANTTWKQLKARTLDWIVQNEPSWLNRDSGSPLYYWQEGNTIGVHPKPDTSYTNGFKIFYYMQSTDMSTGTHYPFSGSTTEYKFLSQFDETLIDGIRYKVMQILEKEYEEAKKMFFEKCEMIKWKLKERKDLEKEAYPRGVIVDTEMFG